MTVSTDDFFFVMGFLTGLFASGVVTPWWIAIAPALLACFTAAAIN